VAVKSAEGGFAPSIGEKILDARGRVGSFRGKPRLKLQENCWKPYAEGEGNQQPSPAKRRGRFRDYAPAA